MHIKEIILNNWLRYRGEHRIELKPTVYAIVARMESDPERSNWTGKTALVESVPFALWGVHRFGTSADAWISHDEREGSVALVLSNGATIHRGRHKGKPFVKVSTDSGSDAATGDEAQEMIPQLLGLERRDFDATCWFPQRAVGKFVLATPEERTKMVSGWVTDLQALAKAEQTAQEEWRKLSSEHGRKSATLTAQEQEQESAKARLAEIGLSAPIEKRLAGLEKEREKLLTREAGLRVVEESRHNLAEFKGMVEELKRLNGQRSEEPKDLEAVRAESGEARSEANKLRAELLQAQGLARGQFDGNCPVIGEACPAKAQVVQIGLKNKTRLKALEELFSVTAEADKLLREKLQTAEQQAREGSLTAARREDLKKRIGERLKRAKEWEVIVAAADEPNPEADPGFDLLAEVEQLRGQLGEKRAIEQQQEARERHLQGLQDELSGLGMRMRLLESASAVLGRNGAQRVIATGAVDEIAGDANRMLSDAGVALQVDLSWFREGKGLSEACTRCGRAFPASVKVKECTDCGAARGPNLIQRLEVELSDRSGAAEDLAGLALQLSASAWVRKRYDVTWATALLDEPFSAMDRANRRSVGRRIAQMVHSAGFEQAFVVAHSPDVMEALPGRIEVIGGDKGSRLEVV